MICIRKHTYAIGQVEVTKPTPDQARATGHRNQIFKIFTRLLKDKVLYHSTSYRKSISDKRDNMYCCYCDQSGNICFGQIVQSTISPSPQVFILQIQPLNITMLDTLVKGNQNRFWARLRRSQRFTSNFD